MSTNNYPGIGYTTFGNDYNCFQKFTVTSTTFGGGSVSGQQPDYIVTFPTQGFILINEGTGVIQVSYNGLTVHDELDTSGTFVVTYRDRILTKIWFRVASGTGTVSLRAWGTR